MADSAAGCEPTQVFLGTLREAEVERINNRISQAIMETCLAMTIFRWGRHAFACSAPTPPGSVQWCACARAPIASCSAFVWNFESVAPLCSTPAAVALPCRICSPLR